MQLLVRVITFLLFIFTSLNCSSGWSVAGYEISPGDTTANTVFIEIIAQDSTMHWYAGKLYHGDNYCMLHNKWEQVRIQ